MDKWLYKYFCFAGLEFFKGKEEEALTHHYTVVQDSRLYVGGQHEMKKKVLTRTPRLFILIGSRSSAAYIKINTLSAVIIMLMVEFSVIFVRLILLLSYTTV